MKDWIKIKAKGYWEWRDELWNETEKALLACKDLSDLNELGVYHRLKLEYWKERKEHWEKRHEFKEEWLAQGYFPGICCALFHPQNTFSFTTLERIPIIHFSFREGFKVYNPRLNEHRKLWESYDKSGANLWAKLDDQKGESLEEKLKTFGLPWHRGFYAENKFDAYVGYSDYLYLGITLSDCIQGMEFMLIEPLSTLPSDTFGKLKVRY